VRHEQLLGVAAIGLDPPAWLARVSEGAITSQATPISPSSR